MSTALSLFIITTILTGGLIGVHWLRRRLHRPIENGQALVLEHELPLGAQKRLLSVSWKGSELLIADSPAGLELLTSNMLKHLSTQQQTADEERNDTPPNQPVVNTAGPQPFSAWLDHAQRSPMKAVASDEEENSFHA